MSLTPGTRLGPYEVLGSLGAGGMGEVYRARDVRLARDVALKVLPDSVADDPDRLARFQREAQVLAALTHPNIGAIYGLEEGPAEAGHYVRALVLELIEGDTLAERIARGAIPVDEALAIAKQIAEALEAAHEQGIIHRDLKPANIKVTPDGVVKVLDFGLAKLTGPAEAGHYVQDGRRVRLQADLTASPTLTSPAMMTGVGMILGTAAYMSPEQAKGREADKRSDIWAFGVVLYEMLTARRAFDGDDVAETLAYVMARDPDWTTLPPGVPLAIRTLLRRCLERDRRKRISDIAVVLYELDGNGEAPPPQPAAAPAADRARTRRGIAVAAAALVVGALTGGGAMWLLRSPMPAATITRFAFDLPDEGQFTSTGRRVLAISPDATRVAFVANARLYLRRLDDLEAAVLAGPQSPTKPVFSPDGQWVAYYTGGALYKIPVAGGAPVRLCGATAPFGISWDDDTIVFGQGMAGILAVPAAGGEPQVWVKPAPGETADGPQLLPGGDALLFSVTSAAGGTR